MSQLCFHRNRAQQVATSAPKRGRAPDGPDFEEIQQASDPVSMVPPR